VCLWECVMFRWVSYPHYIWVTDAIIYCLDFHSIWP
jgi:hypothetical protein